MRIFPRIGLPRHRKRTSSPIRRTRTRILPVAAPLLDLSGAISAASSVENLYASLVATVGHAFAESAVSLFVRDDDLGGFPCCASTLVLSGPAPTKLSADSFVVRRLNSLSAPLQLQVDELNSWKMALHDAPPQVLEKRMQERDVLLQTHSSVLVQLKSKGELLGILSLGTGGTRYFTPQVRETLENAAGQLALVIENAKLLRRLVEHERLRAELAVAAEVQRNLLPAAGSTLAGVDLCGFCQPASHVGGDYYDFVPLANDRIGICIADVAGKGISAALLMSVVQASLRSQLFSAHEQTSVAEVVTLLNRLICTSISSSRYVTCFYGQLDAARSSFHFVNAGHNPPLLYRRDSAGGSFHSLSSDGIVLGMFPQAEFTEAKASLRPGDVMVAYTDGVTEAMSASHEEFSELRLREAIAESSHHSAKEILAHIIARVAAWSQGASQHDDITVIVLRIA